MLNTFALCSADRDWGKNFVANTRHYCIRSLVYRFAAKVTHSHGMGVTVSRCPLVFEYGSFEGGTVKVSGNFYVNVR